MDNFIVSACVYSVFACTYDVDRTLQWVFFMSIKWSGLTYYQYAISSDELLSYESYLRGRLITT